MDPKFPTFLDSAQIAGLHELMNQGNATVQEFQDPPVWVQIRRYDPVEGHYVDLPGGMVHLIRLSFGLREVFRSTGTPIVSETSDGDIKSWADEYRPVVGDRFTWDGMTVEVSVTYPEKFGTYTAEVSLKQGAPGT